MKSNVLSFNTSKKIIDDFEKRYFKYQNESNFDNKDIYKQFIFKKITLTFYTNLNNEYKCVVQGKDLENFIIQFGSELN
ncbi:MAG: hypothetical protein K2H80_00595, partial [Ureaplasma sp.]|nr:hypothetical protein [Ureaplasma sp.]